MRAQRSGRGHCSCGAGSADPGCSALQRAAWLVPGDFPNTLPAQRVIPAPELPAGFQNLKRFFCISSSQHPRLAGVRWKIPGSFGTLQKVLGEQENAAASPGTVWQPRGRGDFSKTGAESGKATGQDGHKHQLQPSLLKAASSPVHFASHSLFSVPCITLKHPAPHILLSSPTQRGHSSELGIGHSSAVSSCPGVGKAEGQSWLPAGPCHVPTQPCPGPLLPAARPRQRRRWQRAAERPAGLLTSPGSAPCRLQTRLKHTTARSPQELAAGPTQRSWSPDRGARRRTHSVAAVLSLTWRCAYKPGRQGSSVPFLRAWDEQSGSPGLFPVENCMRTPPPPPDTGPAPLPP